MTHATSTKRKKSARNCPGDDVKIRPMVQRQSQCWFVQSTYGNHVLHCHKKEAVLSPSHVNTLETCLKPSRGVGYDIVRVFKGSTYSKRKLTVCLFCRALQNVRKDNISTCKRTSESSDYDWTVLVFQNTINLIRPNSMASEPADTDVTAHPPASTFL